jgi:hypothetical protein
MAKKNLALINEIEANSNMDEKGVDTMATSGKSEILKLIEASEASEASETEEENTIMAKSVKVEATPEANEVPANEGITMITDGDIPVFANIPIPTGRASRESKYKWEELEVGQSFFVPDAKQTTFNTLTSTRNKRGDKKYVSKKYEHEGKTGVMVWRTC